MRTLCLVTLGFGLFVKLAHADPFAVALVNDVPAGKKPALVVTANEPVSLVLLDITRQEDGRVFHAKGGPLRAGQKAELTVGDGKSGHAHWKGHLTMRGAWGETGNEVTFESQVGSGGGANIKVTYDRAHLDLEHGVLQFQVGKSITKAELTVVADDGSEVARVDKEFASPLGRWNAIEWTPSAKAVLRLELRVENDSGESTTVKLVPWSVAVAHEEVIFVSGSWAIQASESSKLEASYGKIVDAIEKVRTHEPSLDVRVYIAGYTDTVGNSDDNRKLSQARARAIATWFRDHGLPMPLYYAGLGAEQLRVKTPPNTDEARNRRADYVIGVEEPASGRGRYVELK